MTERPYDAILFDLDGTLVDSAPDLADAVDRALADHGRRPVGEAAVRDWIGNGARRLVARALGGADDGPEPPELEAVLARFFDYYGERVCARSRLYPGVREGLEALHGEGYALAVVTNKPERFARPLLEGLGIAPLLDAVVGGDCTAAKKPDPAPLRLALERLGGPATALMVGDSATDVELARNAGVPVALVGYGYHRGADLRALGAELYLESLAELPALLREEGAARRLPAAER